MVLVALVGFTLWGSLQTSKATARQSQAQTFDALFSDARAAVALEAAQIRSYQLEPSNAARTRYLKSVNATAAVLQKAAVSGFPPAAADATRLGQEQAAFRDSADRLINQVANQDPASRQFDRLEVQPLYYTLQRDIDDVANGYHSDAQRITSELQHIQSRILITMVAGFAIGLGLVAIIWRVVLGYQRRLVVEADASEHLALHDPLTGLPNRALFQRRLEAALRGRQDTQPAVMIVDLNEFKSVNDTLGHHAGDELLTAISRRLQVLLRAGDTVSRLGGDEFAVLLPAVAGVAAATGIARQVGDALRQDFRLTAGPAAVSGSIGLAIADESSTAETLLRRADAAMYRAKADGSTVAVYDPQLDAERPERMALFGELRALLDGGDPDDQLVLYYQPQVCLSTASVTAVEALVRWRHPRLGLLLPGAFLAISESGRLEIPLTYHLLRLAVRDAAAWQEHNPVTVAVNVSPKCLLDEEFAHQVRSALAESGLRPSLLRLEVTESSMMTDPDKALAMLRQVQGDGVQVSIDDFGTGFSSLHQLRQLNADELKVDQTLTRRVATDPGNAVLVRSAIDLAHNLGLFVTAEGVEDLRTLAVLRDYGCDQAQGFGIARPVPVDNLETACAVAEERARMIAEPSRALTPDAVA
ncbi:diguanylate cyclase (GGDEF)-like protein [Hamadaea flava]|uniref:Bifunctional diguanylate cyclase/phosphodiesterase n=1 Tax=Hamadaea flava TaxID=1742688 RepID=A0ABV8M2A2_9ACTN|nr:diguanylate cyclase (GGDEF)-like protein [Hamadaea flava]